MRLSAVGIPGLQTGEDVKSLEIAVKKNIGRGSNYVKRT